MYISTSSSPRPWLGDRMCTASHQAFAASRTDAATDPRAVQIVQRLDGRLVVVHGAVMAIDDTHFDLAVAPGITEVMSEEQLPLSYRRSTAVRKIRYDDVIAARMGRLVWRGRR